MAAVRAGFQLIWGTEICPDHPELDGMCKCGNNLQQRMWQDLTGTECLGNCFTNMEKFSTAEVPDYLTSGMPCPNYSRSGNHTGYSGKTGWMYVEQTKVILKLLPKTIRLEMSDFAEHVNSGSEIIELVKRLSTKYHLYGATLNVWEYGDPSNRARLFIIGTLKSLTDSDQFSNIQFEYPQPTITAESAANYRMIAEPDDQVPAEYWLWDEPTREPWRTPSGGKMHIIARRGKGMGPSEKPNAVQSMESLPNSQTTYNGGGTRPRLDWQMNKTNSVGATRKCVPIEAVRISSTSETYLPIAESYKADPAFVFKCVNNGIPQRTCSAVDKAVLLFLRRVRNRELELKLAINKGFGDCVVQHVHAEACKMAAVMAASRAFRAYADKWPAVTSQQTVIECVDSTPTATELDQVTCSALSAVIAKWRSAQMDTGANISLFTSEAETQMTSKKPSRMQIEVANTEIMKGRCDGNVQICALDTSADAQIGAVFQHKVTTVDNLSRELFSVDNMYADQRFNILLRQPDFESGISEIYRPATGNEPAISIPLRYDTECGGFWLDYVLSKKDSHCELLADYHADMQAYSAKAKAGEHEVSADTAIKIIIAAYANTAVTEVVFGQHTDSVQTNIRGVKAGLRARKKAQTIKEFHSDHGHLGCVGPCEICALASGCARRIYKAVDRHVEQRRAWRFDMDILTWEHRAEDGSKYQVVIRERSTGCFWSLYLYKRSDAISEIRKLILKLRSNPAFQGMNYAAWQELHTDNAGEWGWTNAEWGELEIELAFTTVWTCPDRKEEAHYAERAVGIMEVTIKALMLQRDLPFSWWRDCAEGAMFLLNRFPAISLQSTMPSDGDQCRPLEVVTGGAYSRRQIDRELSYFVAPGTPVLVHDPKVKGSQFQPKASWWVARGMHREQIILWSPFTHATRKSKSYTAFKLARGLSYQRFLSLEPEPPSRRQRQLPTDFNEAVTIKMQRLPEDLVDRSQHPITGQQPLIAVQHAVEQYDEHYNSRLTQLESGGSVTVFGEFGEQLTLDKTNGELYDQSGEQIEGLSQMHCGEVLKLTAKVRNQTATRKDKKRKMLSSFVQIDDQYNPKKLAMWNLADAKAVEDLTIISKCGDRFIKICKQHQIPFSLHSRYREWLKATCTKDDGTTIHNEDVPFGTGSRGHTVKPKLKFPKPSGSVWKQMIGKHYKSNNADDIELRRIQELAVQQVVSELKEQKSQIRDTGKVNFAKGTDHSMFTDPKFRAMAVKARRQKAVAAGHIPEPRSTREALERDHEKWLPSIKEEVQPLFDMGVLDQGPNDAGYSKAELKVEGIDIDVRPAVFVGLYHTHKTNGEGEIDRHKTRCAVKGHKGNMQKGNHFNETFAATPREDTARILTALMVLLNLVYKTGDVVKAYCWADVPPGELIAIRYPPGLKKFHPVTKEELYCVLRKNLYGHPAAGRAWSMHRDSELLRMFNNDEWSCHQCEMDPCLFYFMRKGVKHGRPITDNMREILDQPEISQAWISIHTDDLDSAGTDQKILVEIFRIIDERWSLKETEPDYMLGVKRTVSKDSDGNIISCELTMEAYVQGVADTFREDLPTKTLASAFPEKVYISKGNKPDEGEAKANLARGFMRAVGMILWAVRHCFPEGKYGASQLCGVMACPSDAAFAAAMHMIAYFEQHKTKGILFSANGNTRPVCTSDASNKPDPDDGLAHAGYTVHWADGPTSSKSSKLKHQGLSSEHNEYMGLTSALRCIVWMRQLMSEIGISKLVQQPFVVYGDNIQANRLCKDHFVSTGNQHIFMPYHWNRRAVSEGHAIVKWVQTKFNISDIMTKALNGVTFQRLLSTLCGYGDLKELIRTLETTSRIHTEAAEARKVEGVSRDTEK